MTPLSPSFSRWLLSGSLLTLIAAGIGCHSSGDCVFSEIQPDALPDGRVGQPYFLQLTAKLTGPDCDGKPVYSLGEDRPGHETPLPPGLKLSVDGALSGTPAVA